MIRNAAKRGFDMQMAASYQVWSALLVPIMIPLLVGGAAWLYRRDIWISPLEVLPVVAEKQFAPLLAGMALMHFAPGFSTKVRRPLNVAGNVVLTVALIALLIKMGPALESVSPWVAIAALALAAGCARCMLAKCSLLSRKVRGVTECDPRTLIRRDFSP